MHANCCNMSIVFHENRTILKTKGKEFEETITTINFSYFIIKFNILVHEIKIGFDIKCKFEGKSGLLIAKFLRQKSGLWSLKRGGLLMQVKIIVLTIGRI